jgi:hypothetical protein
MQYTRKHRDQLDMESEVLRTQDYALRTGTTVPSISREAANTFLEGVAYCNRNDKLSPLGFSLPRVGRSTLSLLVYKIWLTAGCVN